MKIVIVGDDNNTAIKEAVDNITHNGSINVEVVDNKKEVAVALGGMNNSELEAIVDKLRSMYDNMSIIDSHNYIIKEVNEHRLNSM